MLRSTLAAVVVGVGLFAGGVAAAWTDPAGRVIFDQPRGWNVLPQNAPANMTYVITATGAAECHVVVQPNGFDARTPDEIRTAVNDDTRFDNAMWTRVLNAVLAPIFPNSSATIVSTAKNDSGFWIVRSAEAANADGPVRVTMQSRPGVDILTACMTFNGAPPTATFEALERSVRHPNDQTWQAAGAAAPAQ